jgi:hypothetical protein
VVPHEEVLSNPEVTLRGMTTDAYAPRWVRSDEVPHWRGSEILPGLFMGGTADDAVTWSPAEPSDLMDDKPYDAVVTLYAWAQPVGWDVEELRYGFADATIDCIDLPRLQRAAQWAWQRWKAGDRVLVRCQAGLNRSGLVTALVLMREGYAPDEAIRLLRERRSPWALCNDEFVRWLLEDAAEVAA